LSRSLKLAAERLVLRSPTTAIAAGLAYALPAEALLERPGGGRVVGQDAVELAARTDAELHEDLAQVVLDRAWADEQADADFRIRRRSVFTG
jgi:hypothetical protein